MIDVLALAEKLATISGDATKLAVLLASWSEGFEFRANAAWIRRVAKKLGTSPNQLRNSLAELAKLGLIEKRSRLGFGRSMSDPPGRVARTPPLQDLDGREETESAESPGRSEEETPPWELPERSEGTETLAVAAEQRAGRGPSPAERCALREPSPRSLSLEASDSEPRTSAHTTVVRAFHDLYVEAYGAKPTWAGKQGAIVKRLLKSHSADEIVRRAEIMFRESRKFPPPPYDILTLSVHFDKFAKSTNVGIAARGTTTRGSNYFGEVDDV